VSAASPGKSVAKRRKARSRPAARSQPKRRSPGIPVSAATVTGVSWEAAAFGSFPFRCVSLAYATLKLPMPTPPAGWWTAIRIPFVTSFDRPPEALFSPRPWPKT
jgi:hypothetical protein